MHENGGVASQLTLSDGPVAVDVDPDLGGRLTQIRVRDVPILVGLDDVPAEMRRPDGSVPATDWGAYPMVPWAGRIRRGRFEFAGVEHRLPINFGQHAIHGVGFSSRWAVTRRGPADVRLELELPSDERWPFGGRVVHDVVVADTAVELSMEVAAGERAFPASFGWHPWFRKPTRLDFRPTAMYRRDTDGIAVDELVAVPPGPWDDCFRNTEPVELAVGEVGLRLTSDCTDWVVYDERAHATCIEPQTGPPDAFTIAPEVVEPGAPRRAWFRIEATT